jgi:hypothetical protein
MIGVLMFCAMFLQSAVPMALRPAIDNDRVTVWDANVSVRPLDAVIISPSGSAEWVPKGTTPKTTGRALTIDLKDHAQPPYPNTTKFPLAFPRPGSKKVFENARVIVWDYTWTPDVATPMHFHDKDVVVYFLEDGDLSSTTPDGKSVVNQYTAGTPRFNQGNRTHTETLVKGKQRAIITELK